MKACIGLGRGFYIQTGNNLALSTKHLVCGKYMLLTSTQISMIDPPHTHLVHPSGCKPPKSSTASFFGMH